MTHVKAENKADPYPLTYSYATLDSASQINYFHEINKTAHKVQEGLLTRHWKSMALSVHPSENGLLGAPDIKTRALAK
ncbi:MAG TPA: hypothetical protein DDZ89_05360 [Clostridiales bacterium]|nr:hypothetical protein [Clostridiales bacterium]